MACCRIKVVFDNVCVGSWSGFASVHVLDVGQIW